MDNAQTLLDAQEYGLHVRGGDWRLGLLVARNVEKGDGRENLKRGKTPANPRLTDPGVGKVSIAAFAKLAKVSQERISNHLEMWEKAAKAGHVPHAVLLGPGDEVKLPDPEKHPTSDYYTSVRGGFNGGKDRKPTLDAVIDSADKLSADERARLANVIVAQPEVKERIIQSGEMALDPYLDLATEAFKMSRDESERKMKESHPSHAARSAADEMAIANRHAERALAEVIQWNVKAGHDQFLLLRSSIQKIERTIEQIKEQTGDAIDLHPDLA